MAVHNHLKRHKAAIFWFRGRGTFPALNDLNSQGFTPSRTQSNPERLVAQSSLLVVYKIAKLLKTTI